MNVTLDLNTSSQFDIDNIYAGRSWPTIVLERFQDDETTPENFPAGDYVFQVFSDDRKRDKVMEVLEGAALTVATNVMTIVITTTMNILKPSVYYFRIFCDVSADMNPQFFHGTITVNP